MKCPRCQHENRSGAKFCEECGTPFERLQLIPATDGVSSALAPALPYCIAVLAVALEIVLILTYNGGRFTYTLDDSYIRLAVSEQIFHLHYGVNAREPSSPSSSIIFPFLLAPFAPFRIHEDLPLALNIVALLAGVALLVLALNHIGLVFTGMEHSLHVMVTLAVVLGLVVLLEEGRLPWWLLAAIVAGPLLRYEGVSVSAGALLVLAIIGRWRPALAAFLACGALVAS